MPLHGEVALVHYWRCLFADLNPPEVQTLNRSVFFEKKSCSSTAAADEFQGTEVSIPAPCQDGEVPPEPSPSVSIIVSAVSIDFTAISIIIAASYGEEGVVLPRG
jgi:hypothetical protein